MISIIPVDGLPEIREGDDLGTLIAERAELEAGDVVVVAQKAVSKAEGRFVNLNDVEPSALADAENYRISEDIVYRPSRVVIASGDIDRQDSGRLPY